MFNTIKFSGRLLGLALLVPLAAGLVGSQLVFAADAPPTPTPAESLTLTCDYPSLKDASNNIFSFKVDVRYAGTQAKVFDLATQVPQGAIARVLNTSGTEITSLRIDPTQFGAGSVTVQFNPGPVPGQYTVAFSVKSGSLSSSIQLNALTTPKFQMHMTPQNGVFTAKITAGQENDIAIRLLNQGTVPLNNIKLSVTGPTGWDVSFVPDIIDIPIPPAFEDKIDIIVHPPSNTPAGDYDIKIKAVTGDTIDSNSIRVTVDKPSVLGWVWIVGAVLVISAVAVLFRRMGQRK